VFFRNVPGLRPGDQVAVGLRVTGVLPEGESLAGLAGPVRVGPGGGFWIAEFPTLEGFVERGPVTLQFRFRRLDEDEALNFSGRLAGAGALLGRPDPRDSSARATLTSLLVSSVEVLASGRSWQFSVTVPERPDEGTHLFVAAPPPGAPPASARHVDLRRLTSGLSFRGERLAWKDTGEDYESSPYVVLHWTRHSRHPRGRHPLVLRGIRDLRASAAGGDLGEALRAAKALLVEVSRETMILEPERAIELQLVEAEEHRVQRLIAERAADSAGAARAREREAQVLERALAAPGSFLDSRERGRLQDRLRRLKPGTPGG
jgi:hypothetical protein